jgi:hypothetical protein
MLCDFALGVTMVVGLAGLAFALITILDNGFASGKQKELQRGATRAYAMWPPAAC